MSQNDSKAAEELQRIAGESGGILLPERVVDEAEDKRSPLHSWFEWDDGEAAHQYRLEQARLLIRRVKITYPTGEGKSVCVRAFVSLQSDQRDGGGYRRTVDVMSDDERCAELLAEARAEMARFRRKYREIKLLADVFAAMEAAEDLAD